MSRHPDLRYMLSRINRIPLITLLVLLALAIVYSTWATLQAVQLAQQARIREISRLSEFYLLDTAKQLRALGGMLEQVDAQGRAAALAQVRRVYQRFTAFYVVDPEGVVTLEDTRGISLLGFDLSGEPFYRAGMADGETFFSDPFISLTTGNVTLSVALPLTGTGALQGSLVGELDLFYLQQVISELATAGEDVTFIVDRQGYLVAHPEASWVQEQRHTAALMQLGVGEGSALFYDEWLGEWVYGSAAPMSNQWMVVSELPLWQALQPIVGVVGLALVAMLASLAAYTYARRYSVQRIQQPINELAAHADALARGESVPLPAARDDDFAEAARLRESYTRMFRAVEERTAELEQANRDLAGQILERQRAEEAVQELNAELEQRVADRTAELERTVQELDAFAYSVSHDLRAPLRGIDGFSQAVLEDYGDRMDETGISYLERVREAVQRMRSQIDALLNLSRLSRAEMYREEVNLSGLAAEILHELAEAEPGREVAVQVQPDLVVEGDTELLLAALGNLLRNAWKFTARTAAAQIAFGCVVESDGSPAFYVRDNGAGFEPSQAERLFTPFQRLHSSEEFEGTGIGLATVQRVVHRHGGRVWAEGTPGRGACFYFTLPGNEAPCSTGEA